MTFTNTNQVAFLVIFPMLEWREIYFCFSVCYISWISFSARFFWYMLISHHSKYHIVLGYFSIIYVTFRQFGLRIYCFSSFIFLLCKPFGFISLCLGHCSYVDCVYFAHYQIICGILIFSITAI